MKPFSLAFIYNSDTRVSAFDVIYYEGENFFLLEKRKENQQKLPTAKLNFRMGSKKIPQRPMSAQPAYQKSVEEELELTSR